MTLAAILYAAFTLVSTAGAYLIGAHFRSRAAGAGLALAVLVFFTLLLGALVWLVRSSGMG